MATRSLTPQLAPTLAAIGRGGRAFWSVVVAVWLVGAGAGLYLLARHAATPGADGAVPGTWPAGTALAPPHGRALLLVFAHPRCPCTRATLSELARLMPRVGTRVEARVVFYHPTGTDPSWGDTGLRAQAVAIPGVTVVPDADGAEARRFGAETSGAAVLYDATGARVFHGGLTAARGHEGASAGTEAIASWAQGHPRGRSATPVFGCSIWDPTRLLQGRDGLMR